MAERFMKRLFAAFLAVAIAICIGWVSAQIFKGNLIDFASADDFFDPSNPDWDAFYVRIATDTTWHKGDTLVFYKEVIVDENATLTIEAGAEVHFNGGGLSVWWGNIVASGTESEPIVFMSDNNAPFLITFVDSADLDGTGKTSALTYIDVVSGGSYSDPDYCGTIGRSRSFFFETALAGDCPRGMVAMYYAGGRVSIDHANFIGNHYADISIDASFSEYNASDFFHISHSNFGNNTQSTAVISHAYCTESGEWAPCRNEEVDFRDNWWGDIGGPYFETSSLEVPNLSGTGNRIEGDGALLFRPVASEPFIRASAAIDCTENCFSNVLFLPGVEASRLYAKDDPSCLAINCENQLWEPNRNDDVRKLYLDHDGKSAAAYDIYTRDVLDEINVVGQNIYKSFIAKMDALKNDEHLINDWAPVPYDWRLSLEDIVNGGASVTDGFSYADTIEAPRIITELERLAATSKTGKVTIVTHSNGGLVAKALMRKIGDAETRRLIDTVVFVGVPQVGTPVAIGAMLHGYDQTLAQGLILDKPTARGLAEYMPSAYTLLPSEAYFDSVKTSVVSFDTGKLPDWSEKYGDVIDSQNEMRTFLTDAYKRVDSTDEDVESPSELHTSLLNAANTRHEGVDTWKAPEGVRAIQIAGWGVPLTVGGMHYTSETHYSIEQEAHVTPYEEFKAEPLFTIDGDGTVVAPSALFMADAERYWVDLDSYNIFLVRHADHSSILEVPELEDFIEDIVTKSIRPIIEYEYISTEVPPFGIKDRLQYSLHSPLTFDLYDDQGRHTGLDKDGNIEEQIPGTYYRQFGEVKYIFSDAGAKFHIVMHGYATGTFTLEIEALQGDISTGKIVFKDMPTTDKTDVTIDVSNGIDGVGNLDIDKDGDGTVDYRIQPEKGKSVTFAGVSGPATTLYTASFGADMKKFVAKKEKKQVKKKQKRNGRSKREQRRENKIRKAIAMKVPVRIASEQPIPSPKVRENEKIEEKKDVVMATPVVSGDSTGRENMLESAYRPPSEDDQGWSSKVIQLSQDILRRISDALHSFMNRWIK